MSNLKHLSRRVKANPHVPADLTHEEVLQAWVSLDKKLAWACWGFICSIGCVLVGALTIKPATGFEIGQPDTITQDINRLSLTRHKHAGKSGTIVRREDGGGYWDVSFKGRTGGVAIFAEDQFDKVG